MQFEKMKKINWKETFISVCFEIIIELEEKFGLFEEIWQNPNDSLFLLPKIMQRIHFNCAGQILNH